MKRKALQPRSKRWWLGAFVLAGISGLGLILLRVQSPRIEPAEQVTRPGMISSGGWWRPSPGTSWQWQLSGEIDTSLDVQMYDIDLFDVPVEVIDKLHREGRAVVCYFSAGTYEDWRPDEGDFPREVIGKALPDWPSEKWLDIRQLDQLGPLMALRMNLAAEKGCDGVEPDNVDGYANNTGFPLSHADQLRYNQWLAEQAHARGLSVGLKNDLDQVGELEECFDWAINEECFTYQECELLSPFIAAGKAVFGVEYSLEPADFCPQANALNFDFMRKEPELGVWRQACR